MSLPSLSVADFATVFQAVHGHAPFPWQSRLVERLAEPGGVWPKLLDLPTGTGKTAALDAAVFHLALQAEAGSERTAPMRIAFVVDRRVIVDAAFERARILEQALAGATGTGALARMAARLRHLSGDGPPLVAARLRGGVPREDDWARAPNQPTLLCSTVDQVGSRLLFRGYGVSDSMKPVHAGLLGSDCLILLDEAHLAAPFAQTLARIGLYRSPPWCTSPPGPWGVVTVSATPQTAGLGLLPNEVFPLEPEDRAHDDLARRLGARKPARLRLIGKAAAKKPDDAAPAETQEAQQARAFCEAAQELLEPAEIRRLAVVVNRVALARHIFGLLEQAYEGKEDTRCILLTGRIRETDRQELSDKWFERLRAGAPSESERLVVVATQTIEAGADFDFDALVTQIAPLDALRQRFGRLNRLGLRPEAPALILATGAEVAKRADDPVYGTRAKATWDWLLSVAEAPVKGRRKGEPVLDFGIDAFEPHRQALGDGLSDLIAEPAQAPFLRPGDVLLLSWTAPVPAVDPDIALFLHGPKAGPADVQIVWRADLTPETLDQAGEVLALVPPHGGETLAVPIWAARAWLSRSDHADQVADLEGSPEPATRSAPGRPAFRWAGPESDRTGLIWPAQLRPGDVIVVPNTYGGSDEHGWTPETQKAVPDVGDQGAETGRRWLRRVHPALLLEESMWQAVRSAAVAQSDLSDQERLESFRAAGLDLPEGGCRFVWPTDWYGGVVLVGLRRVPGRRPWVAATEDDQSGSLTGLGLTLDRHGTDVGEKARLFARAAGLPQPSVHDLEIAGRCHDEGKRDARFQTWLRGVDRLAAALVDDAPLAKSRRSMTQAESQAARRQAGLPEPWRHEVRSVGEALHHQAFATAFDPELVLWLIGTHHGHGRPLFPHCDPAEPDETPGPHRFDFAFNGRDWAQMFEHLKAQYGPWELARLEAILRLADHRASEEAEL